MLRRKNVVKTSTSNKRPKPTSQKFLNQKNAPSPTPWSSYYPPCESILPSSTPLTNINLHNHLRASSDRTKFSTQTDHVYETISCPKHSPLKSMDRGMKRDWGGKGDLF
ncbi:hypothetical protein TL16_g04461 [Triparma laevis f. inornata]|uniref:Uncharacterized protein n=1 Tax=Triparma laevis f. inornata TaxID=1714386 RepID=A0A9W7A6I0_9STRA|nr:hypothetical protein TL16_g04461 [Triparma laevis f. inornata]